MTYEVLARRLRPSVFSELIGQDQTVRALTNALDSGRLHHAYLFTGTRGVGKTTIARILAKCLNCEEGVSSQPCGKCSACLGIKENSFIDLIEVDAASRTGVDDTRELLENTQYLPSNGRFKVYLIDEVHMLSTASFNALLKTLEEPPDHVKFLLATTDPKKVPVTVLSRCLQFQLRNLSAQSISGYLEGILNTEGVDFDSAAIEVIAKNALGSVRDALSLTDQAIAHGDGHVSHDNVVDMLGVVGRDEIDSILSALEAGSARQIIEFSSELAERNTNFSDLLKGVIEALHALAVDCSLGKTLDKNFTPEELQLYYQIALVGLRDINVVPDERSGFEMTMLRMLSFAPSPFSSVPSRNKNVNDSEASPSLDDTQDFSDASLGATSSAEPSQVLKEELGGRASETSTQETGFVSHDQEIDWEQKIDEMGLGGISRMIAENSVVSKWQLPNIKLILDSNHDALLSPQLTEELQEAICLGEGREVSLKIETGVLEQETIAKKKVKLEAEMQASAEAVVKDDPKITGLLDEFEGELKEVKPLD